MSIPKDEGKGEKGLICPIRLPCELSYGSFPNRLGSSSCLGACPSDVVKQKKIEVKP